MPSQQPTVTGLHSDSRGCISQRDLVRLRLQRLGVRNNPFYRIVAADSRSPRDGKHLELLGAQQSWVFEEIVCVPLSACATARVWCNVVPEYQPRTRTHVAGTYNPRPNNFNEKVITLNFDRIKHWLVVGAQPSVYPYVECGLSGR